MERVKPGIPWTSDDIDYESYQLGRFNDGPPEASVITHIRRTIETSEDIQAEFGDTILVDTDNGDVTVTLPTPSLGAQSVIVVKNDHSLNVVHLIGVVNSQSDRTVVNENESLELLPTSSGYTII